MRETFFPPLSSFKTGLPTLAVLHPKLDYKWKNRFKYCSRPIPNDMWASCPSVYTPPTYQHCYSRTRWWEFCSKASSHQVQVLSGWSAELCCPSHIQAHQEQTFILIPLVCNLELGEGFNKWQDISWCACKERHANASASVRNR